MKHAGGKIGTRRRWMAPIFGVQTDLGTLAQHSLPRLADRDDHRLHFPRDVGDGAGNDVLSLWRRLTRPRQIKDSPGLVRDDLRSEQPDVVVVAMGILHRERALLLQNDVVPGSVRDGLLRFPG